MSDLARIVRWIAGNMFNDHMIVKVD